MPRWLLAQLGATGSRVSLIAIDEYKVDLSMADIERYQPLLALSMNGEPLPIQHGYPLRLVVPGWYGVASVKWLSEIDAVERPFDGFFQVDRYRYEWTRNGQQVTEPVTLQRVRALITEPTHEQELESSDLTIRGVAWSGAAPIARVDVSVDNGPWHQARLLGTRQRHSWQWWELIVVLERSPALGSRFAGSERFDSARLSG